MTHGSDATIENSGAFKTPRTGANVLPKATCRFTSFTQQRERCPGDGCLDSCPQYPHPSEVRPGPRLHRAQQPQANHLPPSWLQSQRNTVTSTRKTGPPLQRVGGGQPGPALGSSPRVQSAIAVSQRPPPVSDAATDAADVARQPCDFRPRPFFRARSRRLRVGAPRNGSAVFSPPRGEGGAGVGSRRCLLFGLRSSRRDVTVSQSAPSAGEGVPGRSVLSRL